MDFSLLLHTIVRLSAAPPPAKMSHGRRPAGYWNPKRFFWCYLLLHPRISHEIHSEHLTLDLLYTISCNPKSNILSAENKFKLVGIFHLSRQLYRAGKENLLKPGCWAVWTFAQRTSVWRASKTFLPHAHILLVRRPNQLFLTNGKQWTCGRRFSCLRSALFQVGTFSSGAVYTE